MSSTPRAVANDANFMLPAIESDCGPVGVIWESSVDRQAVDGRTDQLFWGGCPQEFKIM